MICLKKLNNKDPSVELIRCFDVFDSLLLSYVRSYVGPKAAEVGLFDTINANEHVLNAASVV